MTSRVAQLIRYFVDRAPGCGRTRIVKFLYMADHEARRYLGRPLTDLEYRWDSYGPYDPEILRQIQYLGFAGYISEEANQGDGYVWYRYRPTQQLFPCPMKREEAAILDYVVANYADMKLNSLLEEVVYQTRPMSEANHRGERLQMELIDNELRTSGLELEHMIEASEELKSGGGKYLDNILDEIHE